MSFVTDAISSALAPPGGNARNTSQDRQGEAQALNLELLRQIEPLIKRQLQLRTENQPYLEAILRQIQAAGSQKNILGGADAVRQQSLMTGLRNARALQSLLGPNSGAARGAAINASNQSNIAGNQFLAQQFDPNKMLEDAAKKLQITNYATAPDMNLLAGLAGNVYGRPAVQVSPGLGDIAGQLAGIYLSKRMDNEKKEDS